MSYDRRQTSKAQKGGIALLLLIVVFFFAVLAFGREYVGNLQIEREIAQLEQERERLEQKREEAWGLIDELSSEYYLEREGRLKHGLARSGETLIVVKEDEPVQEGRVLGEQIEVRSNPMQWFYYLFVPEEFARHKL